MKIIWKPDANNSEIGTLNVYVGERHYYQDEKVSINDDHLYVQAHWGSGVKFSEVSITRRQA